MPSVKPESNAHHQNRRVMRQGKHGAQRWLPKESDSQRPKQKQRVTAIELEKARDTKKNREVFRAPVPGEMVQHPAQQGAAVRDR